MAFLCRKIGTEATMKRPEGDSTVKELEQEHDHLTVVRFYREKMNSQPFHSALRSFNVQDGARMSGVYEIYRNNEVRETFGGLVLKETVCCVGGKVKH